MIALSAAAGAALGIGLVLGVGIGWLRWCRPELADLDAQLDAQRPRAGETWAASLRRDPEPEALTGSILPAPVQVRAPGTGRVTYWARRESSPVSDGGWRFVGNMLVPPPGAQAIGMGLEKFFTPLTWGD